MSTTKTEDKEKFIQELPGMVMLMDGIRRADNNQLPVEVTLAEVVQEKYGMDREAFLEKIGVNTRISTMQNLFTMPNQNIRWIVPEIIREAITLGMRQAPFYPHINASDQPIA